MTSKRSNVFRSILGVGLASVAVCLIAGSGTASATETVALACPATITINIPAGTTSLPDGWSSSPQTVAVNNAWVTPTSHQFTLSCGYGGNSATISKLTSATCTPNAARNGFTCNRAP